MFSDDLRQLRTENNISRKELADAIGVSVSAISNYENGSRKPDNDEIWIRLAKFFNVTVDYLMGLEQANSTSQNTNTTNANSTLSTDKTQRHRNQLADKIRNSTYTDKQLKVIDSLLDSFE